MKSILPKQLSFKFGDYEFIGELVDGRYTIKRLLTKDLVCDNILVEHEGSIIDIIEEDVKLLDGDTLHFEYEINVELF